MSERDDTLREMVDGWNRDIARRTALAKATDAKEIAELEARFGMTQQEAVMEIVEETAWGRNIFPFYQDCPGSFQEELESLRWNWDDYVRAVEIPIDHETIKQEMADIPWDPIEEWRQGNRYCTHLIKTSDPKQVAVLERRFGITQENAVVHFVEQTDWGIETFPQYQDRRGTFQERLAALRAKWGGWERFCSWSIEERDAFFEKR